MRIPIVNEEDEIIKIIDSTERMKGDIGRVSALWITNEKGEILLAQRSFTKKRDPGVWDPAVAGTVEEGETYEQNIIKEAEEELSKSKIENMYQPNDTSKSQDLLSESRDMMPENIDGMLIPPSKDKRTFNENDVKGEIDKDEEGKNDITELPNGDKVDKMGRRVNDKGFLIDKDGNVID